ncbi:MAG: SBBP repeat-containing protein, partial [Bradymonadaceae bacterium]
MSDNLAGQTYNGGDWDAFVAAFDPTGKQKWVNLFGTFGEDFAKAVTTAGRGNLYVAGKTAEDLGGRTHNGGRSDGFVAKFDGSGNQTWVRLLGTSLDEVGKAVTTDGAGDLYVAGFTEKDLGGRSHNGGEKDGFVAKIDGTGERQWVRLVGTSGLDMAKGVTTDGDGTIYVAGQTAGNLGEDTNHGYDDGFV